MCEKTSEELHAARAERQAEIARAQGVAYVWGRQDAGESPRDTGYSVAFGEAYGEHVRAFEEGRTHFRMCHERFFEEWRTPSVGGVR